MSLATFDILSSFIQLYSATRNLRALSLTLPPSVSNVCVLLRNGAPSNWVHLHTASCRCCKFPLIFHADPRSVQKFLAHLLVQAQATVHGTVRRRHEFRVRRNVASYSTPPASSPAAGLQGGFSAETRVAWLFFAIGRCKGTGAVTGDIGCAERMPDVAKSCRTLLEPRQSTGPLATQLVLPLICACVGG